jgi:hypothetical protein
MIHPFVRKYGAALLFVLTIVLCSSSVPTQQANAVHPLYVSVTTFTHNAKEEILEITIKVFVDDLEKALKKKHKTAVSLTHRALAEKAKEMVEGYMKEHLYLTINDNLTTQEFVGCEIEKAALWIYFQVPRQTNIKKISVSNSILYEMQAGQITIMHAQVGGIKKSTRISNPETKAIFEF